MAVARFGVSIETDLLEALDAFVEMNGFPNRSRAIRYLLEKNLVEEKWKCNNEVAGMILLVYDSSDMELVSKITRLQNQYYTLILGCQKFFLKENECMEIVSIHGVSSELTNLSEQFITLKGVKRGKLLMTRV